MEESLAQQLGFSLGQVCLISVFVGIVVFWLVMFIGPPSDR